MSRKDMIDGEGENQAIRCFLILYGGAMGVTVGQMRDHLRRSGWDGCWPAWVPSDTANAHLTKAGAQLWLRHLFNLEDSSK